MALLRSGMQYLITETRSLIGDIDEAKYVFTDLQIQDRLDQWRTMHRRIELGYIESYTLTSPPVTEFREFFSTEHYWEASATFQKSDYLETTPDTLNWNTGVWTFEASQNPPLFISGQTYDLYGASVDLLDMWIARVKLQFSFTTDGSKFNMIEQVKNLSTLRALYIGNQGITTTTLVRSDI